MRQLRLSKPALNDLDDIWFYTIEVYGFDQAEAYDTLIWQAITDIQFEPDKPTSRLHPEIGPHVRSYKIALSKKRSTPRIGSPRHIVFYTLEFDEEIFVMRILKDDMDAQRHLQLDFP